jgi:hypothetical protein
MAPLLDVECWVATATGRFYSRVGRRWHSIAWHVDDIVPPSERLQDQGNTSETFLRRKGAGIVARDDTALLTDPTSTISAPFLFTISPSTTIFPHIP